MQREIIIVNSTTNWNQYHTFLTLCLHIGSYLINILDYNYKLRGVIGREDDFTTNKWKWFNTQVHDTFLWSRIISQALVDYTDMGRAISHILDNLCAASVSMKDSIRSTTSYFNAYINSNTPRVQ